MAVRSPTCGPRGSDFGQTGCTPAHRIADAACGAERRTSEYMRELHDGIVWGNLAGERNQLYGLSYRTVAYCDVQGESSGQGSSAQGPAFVDFDGPDNDVSTWANNDDHVLAGSPGIDVGGPNFVPSSGETDLDGNKRTWDGNGDGAAIVDMDAYESGLHRYGNLNCDGRDLKSI